MTTAITTMMLTRTAAAAAVATALTGCASMFAAMDANPSLFLYDFFLQQQQHQERRRRRQEHFSHQRIWITGASSGLGAELAKQLASYGASLVLSARNVDQLHQVAAACRELQQPSHRTSSSSSTSSTVDDHHDFNNNKIIVIPVDFMQCTTLSSSSSSSFSEEETETERMERVIDQVLQATGGTLDCVIFNAGQGHMSPALETSIETTERMFRINALAPIYSTKILLSKLKQQQEQKSAASGFFTSSATVLPHLVITSSLGGIMGIPLSASYAASKHALHGYFSSLQAECPSLRVDLVCPGPLATDFHQNSQQQQQQQTQQNAPLDPSTANTPVTESSHQHASKEMYKMPVERCAQLVISAMLRTQTSSSSPSSRGGGGAGAPAGAGAAAVRGGSYHCSWLAPQPTLLGMYLNQYFPSWFHRFVLQTMGPIRVQAWNMGLNLYDASSWTRARQALERQKQVQHQQQQHAALHEEVVSVAREQNQPPPPSSSSSREL